MSTRREFSREDVAELLGVLGARLSARGVHGSVYVVGGAAISTMFDDGRRLTTDIDALTSPADVIAVEAARIAIERDLPSNWLNSNARPWIPAPSLDVDAMVTELPGLTVTVASPRYLLAMKMAAFRAIDRSDLVRLFARLDIQTPEQAADIVDEVYGLDDLANPGREESIICARSVLRAAKVAPRSARYRSAGRQSRAANGRFAPRHVDDPALEVDDERPQG